MNTMLTLQDIERARHFYARGYWRTDTLYSLLRASAEATPDRFAFRDTNARLTFRVALEWVDALAQDLHGAGIAPGDRVSIWLPSRIETALVFMACSRMGYVCNTSLHRDYTCNEIVALIERAGSAAFFAQAGYGADAAKNDIFSMLGAVIGAVLIAASVYLCYAFADRLAQVLGATSMSVIMRLSSFLLVCIGTQIIWNGLSAMLKTPLVTGHPG